jgi:hypothetical protein
VVTWWWRPTLFPPPLPTQATYRSYFHSIQMIWKIRNMVGTHWELKGNTVGTHCELRKNEKKILTPPPPPPQTYKENKIETLWLHLGPSHWLHEISLPKRVHHHFWPGLITPCNKHPIPIEWFGTSKFWGFFIYFGGPTQEIMLHTGFCSTWHVHTWRLKGRIQNSIKEEIEKRKEKGRQ